MMVVCRHLPFSSVYFDKSPGTFFYIDKTEHLFYNYRVQIRLDLCLFPRLHPRLEIRYFQRFTYQPISFHLCVSVVNNFCLTRNCLVARSEIVNRKWSCSSLFYSAKTTSSAMKMPPHMAAGFGILFSHPHLGALPWGNFSAFSQNNRPMSLRGPDPSTTPSTLPAGFCTPCQSRLPLHVSLFTPHKARLADH